MLSWYLPAVSAPQAWDVNQGAADTVIAVIDTGIEWSHPDLVDNIAINEAEDGDAATDNADNDGDGFFDNRNGWDFVNLLNTTGCDDPDCQTADNDPSDAVGHGTFVAGVAAATTNNGLGVAGTCPGCKLLALRAGFKHIKNHDTGVFEGAFDKASIRNALDYTITANPPTDVLNLSLGKEGSAGNDASIHRLIQEEFHL